MEAVERAEPGAPEWDLLMPDHMARYCLAAEFVRGKSVLDAGTGTGYGATVLKSSGARSVQAVDISEEAIARARKLFGESGVEFLVDDCEELGRVKGQFDVICNFENIEHLRQPENFLHAAARRLADEGVFFCSTPDRAFKPEHVNGKPSNQFHVHEWYRDEFATLIASHFEEIEIRVQVQATTFQRRQEGINALREHLSYLWGNPVLKATRALGRLVGRSYTWPTFEGLAVGTVADYPIVHADIAPLIGASWCHFAICRRPRR